MLYIQPDFNIQDDIHQTGENPMLYIQPYFNIQDDIHQTGENWQECL